MTAFSDAAENALLDFLFRGQALTLAGATAGAGTGFTTVYVGLLTVAPTDSTAGTEMSGGGYARVAVPCTMTDWSGTQGAGTTTVSTGTSGTISNNNAVTFPDPSSTWGVPAGVALYSASSGGTLLAYGVINGANAIQAGEPGRSFAAGTLQFQLDN